MRRLVRTVLLGLAGVLLALGFTVAPAAPASAASDQIEKFAIEYTMGTDGVLQAKETIVWRFGSESGRHGIDRYFVTREPYDDQQDAVYTVDIEDVSSPDPGVATQYSENTSETDGGRGEQLRIRIGDPDETISSPTATYVITYSVKGAMRTFSGYDEFYWDATGSDWKAPMTDVSVKATVPGGAQELSCFAGPVQSKNPCTSAKVSDGVGEFTQASLPAKQGMTIGVKIKSGLVTDNAPHLEPDGSKLSAGQRAGVFALLGAGLVALIGSPIVGTLWWRKNGRDRRYAGLAPGTVPLPGQQAPVVASDPDLPIPVAFTPPRIPVAEAGLLIDGQVDTRETAATIIDLAVKGALTVQSEGKKDFQVTLVDPNRATAPHEMVLLTELFGGRPPGAVEDLSKQGSMNKAHLAMQKSVRNQVASRGWFRAVPSAAATSGFGFGLIVFAVFLGFTLGAVFLLLLVPLLPILITFAIIRFKMRRGQRTADGRAVCDQVEGFKTYLATAEAEQIRFEEGEDIFSKYLPWAITFELADRWAKICGDLVAMGRIPNETPYWYVGSYHMAAFNSGFLTSSLTTAAAPAASSGASGTGFGGGSSFGGGGFSGGGGGGGGGGSW